MASRRRAPKFTEAYVRPLRKPSLLWPAERQKRYIEEDTKRFTLEQAVIELARLNELLDHYNIPREDPDRWFTLSLLLAAEYEPRFKAKPRPRKGPEGKQWFRLVAEVDILRAEQGVGVAKACTLLDRRLPAPFSDLPKVNIENRYYEFRKRIREHPALAGFYKLWANALNDGTDYRPHLPVIARIMDDAWENIRQDTWAKVHRAERRKARLKTPQS
jgi:hypothetical protein